TPVIKAHSGPFLELLLHGGVPMQMEEPEIVLEVDRTSVRRAFVERSTNSRRTRAFLADPLNHRSRPAHACRARMCSPAVTDYTAEDGEGAQGSYQRPLPRPLHPCAPVQILVLRELISGLDARSVKCPLRSESDLSTALPRINGMSLSRHFR